MIFICVLWRRVSFLVESKWTGARRDCGDLAQITWFKIWFISSGETPCSNQLSNKMLLNALLALPPRDRISHIQNQPNVGDYFSKVCYELYSGIAGRHSLYGMYMFDVWALIWNLRCKCFSEMLALLGQWEGMDILATSPLSLAIQWGISARIPHFFGLHAPLLFLVYPVFYAVYRMATRFFLLWFGQSVSKHIADRSNKWWKDTSCSMFDAEGSSYIRTKCHAGPPVCPLSVKRYYGNIFSPYPFHILISYSCNVKLCFKNVLFDPFFVS